MGQRKPKEDKPLEVRELLTPISLVPGKAVSYDENNITYSSDHDTTSLSVSNLRGVVQSDDVTYQYNTISVQCAEEMHRFRMTIAAKLAPALNAAAAARPQGTLDEKKALATWVNSQLEPLDLAVQCPKTGQPAKLRGTSGNKWPDVGRFYFEIQKNGKPYKSTYADDLPNLTLRDANPAFAAEITWQKSVGTKSSRRGRSVE